jgi:hypothetical protein
VLTFFSMAAAAVISNGSFGGLPGDGRQPSNLDVEVKFRVDQAKGSHVNASVSSKMSPTNLIPADEQDLKSSRQQFENGRIVRHEPRTSEPSLH